MELAVFYCETTRLKRNSLAVYSIPEQQNVLAWACRLREDRRLSSLQLLLEALLEAAKPGGRLDGRFAEPVPSDRALPTVQEISVGLQHAWSCHAATSTTRPRHAHVPGRERGVVSSQQMVVSARALADVGVQADTGWARDAVREYALQPAPSLFLGVQPKPRTGAMCYMSVFGA